MDKAIHGKEICLALILIWLQIVQIFQQTVYDFVLVTVTLIQYLPGSLYIDASFYLVTFSGVAHGFCQLIKTLYLCQASSTMGEQFFEPLIISEVPAECWEFHSRHLWSG